MSNGNNLGAEKLAKYGLAGVCIALILLMGFIFNQFFGIISNHINDNTEAMVELKNSVDKLNDTTNRQVEVIKSLEYFLKK